MMLGVLAAGLLHWEVLEETPGLLRARLDFGNWPELNGGFPFPHRLELSVELSDERLRVDAVLTPTGEVTVPVAFGFHPVLQLPGVPREQWIVALPVTSRMELDDRMLPTGRSGPVEIPPGPLGDRTFDDAFDGLANPPEFAVAGGGRRLSLRFLEGYRFAQVWAPPDGPLVAFEPMTAPVNPFESDRTLLAEPGSAYRASFEIGVGVSAR